MSYQGQYALIENGSIIRIDSKPYLENDGFPEWRPIIDNPPAYDPATQNLTQNPQEQWAIGANDVTVTYTVSDKTAQEQLDYQRAQIPLETLEVTQWTVPADGTSHVIAKYYSTVPVNFVVNGEIRTVAPNDVYTAELEVGTEIPGPLEIKVKNKQAVVIATEV